MTRKYVQTHKHYLKATISSTATSITLTFLQKMGGASSLSMTDYGDLGIATIDPTSASKAENISFTGITANANGTYTLTGVTRGLKGVDDYATGGNQVAHSGGATLVFSNSAVFYDQFGNIYNAQTWALKQSFTVVPESAADATGGNDLVRYSQLQSALLGTLLSAPLVMPGNGGEDLVVDQLVFLNRADSEWYKADADTAAEVENVMLGITRGAGTDGAAIASGITILGNHTFSTAALTANNIYYASNTAGGVSTTPGTNEVTLGIAISTTVMNFLPRFDQQITEDQQDALAGTSGTPSASNKYVTDDDTTGTGAIVRSSLISDGGDGSDGALDTSGGTVNIDCSNANYVVKNYTSINVETNNLTFTNPASDGTTILLRSQGNVTVSANIDVSGMGAAGGAGGTGDGGAGAAGTEADGIFDDETDHAGQATSASPAITGGATGSIYLLKRAYAATQELYEIGKTLMISPGSGGGGGGASDGGSNQSDGGAGGRGGGALIIECALDLNFTGTIDVSGVVGTDGVDISAANPGAGGGGGGGAAGMAVVVYNSATSTAGTISSAGGSGGDGGDATNTSGSGSGSGGGGGGGAAAYPGIGGSGANGVNSATNANGTTGTASPSNSAGGGGGSGAKRHSSTGTSTGGVGGAGGASNGGLVVVNVL